MKKRVAKKHARAFLEGRKVYPTATENWGCSTDGDYRIITIAIMPEAVRREVYAYARRAGWGGRIFDAPDVLDIQWPDEEKVRGNDWQRYFSDMQDMLDTLFPENER